MRVILAIAIAAAFVVAVWSGSPTNANTKMTGGVSIDPGSMMSISGSLPTHEYATF